MKKINIILFIFCFIFINCNKKDETKHIQENFKKEVQIQNNTDNENILLYNIENITFTIFSDLNIQWEYMNLEDFLIALNISNNYTIDKQVIKNINFAGGEGFFHIFIIKSNQYTLRIYAHSKHFNFIDDPIIYRLASIEVEINNNYNHLFPYRNMNEYLNDKDFGNISELNQNENNIFYNITARIMEYGGDDRFGYSELIFIDGILKSIRIITFFS